MVKTSKKEKKRDDPVQDKTSTDDKAVHDSRKISMEVKDNIMTPLIKLKQQNQKLLEKSCKTMDQAVKENVDQKQAQSAVKALQKYFTLKNKNSDAKKKLLADDDNSFIQLSFTLTKLPMQPSPKPIMTELPHPIYGSDYNTRACLFVRDPESDMKKKLENADVPCLGEVIGYDRLNREFKQFKDKRSLLNDFDLFFSDIRVYQMLPEKLGKQFYLKKLYPCPMKLHGLDNKQVEQKINSAIACTYFMPSNGPNYSVKIGRVSQDAKDVAKNVMAALPQLLGHLTCWDDISFENVQQISLKVDEQIDLPIYSNLNKTDVEAFVQQKS